MTSTFERIYTNDSPREIDQARESLSTALSDQEYLEKIRRDCHAINAGSNILNAVRVSEPKKTKRTKKVVV